MEHFARTASPPHRLVVAGGVAANKSLSVSLAAAAKHIGFEMFVPAPALCTDNAAMIAWGGLEQLAIGRVDRLDVAPRARWPLDTMRRQVAGAKA
jgi:N6-L-threonylcarbamoyladenine synthase